MGDKLYKQFEELKADFGKISSQFELSRLSDKADDIDEFSRLLTKFVAKKLDSTKLAFFSHEEKSYQKLYCKNTNAPEEVFFKSENEGINQLLQSSKPIYAMNKSGENIYLKFIENWTDDCFKPSILLPFVHEDNILAILFIGEKKDNKDYEKEDFEFLEQIIKYASNVIFKLQKQKERDSHITKLQKTIHNISILYSIGQTLNFIDDLKKLLSVILDKALKAVNAEKGSLMLYDSAVEKLSVKVVYGLDDKEAEEEINLGLVSCTSIKVGEGIAGRCFSEKKSIISNLGKNDPRFFSPESTETLSNVSSILCVPLVVKGEAVGIINITNKKNNELFNQDDLEFMEALANQAAIAIDSAKLFELATKDGLTGLYIYRHFHHLLENEVKRTNRYKHSLTLLMMDIDNFKQINDTHGHTIGDKILKEIGNVITTTCRKIDMPSRYGGEEFAVILPETPLKNAINISERLRENIQKITVETKKGALVNPAVSIGMAGIPDNTDNPFELIESADTALYHAKANGKNCISIFSAEGCSIFSKLVQ